MAKGQGDGVAIRVLEVSRLVVSQLGRRAFVAPQRSGDKFLLVAGFYTGRIHW
jgi:hypothetical protein